jgi:hypothetical protein
MIYPAPGKHRVFSGISETVELNVANEEGGPERLRDIVLGERLNDRERISRGRLKVILNYTQKLNPGRRLSSSPSLSSLALAKDGQSKFPGKLTPDHPIL